MKIVINKRYGGFGLSSEALELYQKKTGKLNVSKYNIERNDPSLVEVVNELGPKANGPLARLVIVEVPDDVAWDIEEYDGIEWVAEKHRTWE